MVPLVHAEKLSHLSAFNLIGHPDAYEVGMLGPNCMGTCHGQRLIENETHPFHSVDCFGNLITVQHVSVYQLKCYDRD